MLACRSGCGKTSPSKFTKNGSFNAGTDGGLCRCRDGRESKVFPTRFHLTPLRSNRYGETYRGSVVVFFGQWKDENSFKHRWDGTYEREGVHDLHFHDLRHTFASWLMQGGGDYMVIEKLLGHRLPGTGDLYLHDWDGRFRDAVFFSITSTTTSTLLLFLSISN